MKQLMIGFLSVSFVGAAFAGDSAVSATFDLDATDRYVVSSPLAINYSPNWVDGADGSGASVAIYAVQHVGMEQPVTTLVYRAEAGVAGSYAYTPASATAAAQRLVMSVEKDSEVLGTLVRDIAFGVSATKAGVSADSRAVALQEVADATGTVPVVYDAAWRDGTASMRLDFVNRTRAKYGAVVVTTNAVASALTDAGTVEWQVPSKDGFDCLQLTFLDAKGEAVGEALESAWFDKRVPRGLLLFLR